MRRLYYIHGFASSARSSKGAFLSARCAERGVPLVAPDFNAPDFETLTASRMLVQLAGEAGNQPPGPIALIGSSLGGFVAWHAAALQESGLQAGGDAARASEAWRGLASTHPIERLILLAPALDFPGGWRSRLTPGQLKEWRDANALSVFHYGENAERIVRFDLYEDGLLYEGYRRAPSAPTLMIHGRRDEIVDPAMVERAAAGRPNVRLMLVDDDHLLHESMDLVWRETARFLDLDA